LPTENHYLLMEFGQAIMCKLITLERSAHKLCKRVVETRLRYRDYFKKLVPAWTVIALPMTIMTI